MSIILSLAVFCVLWLLIEVFPILLKMTGLELNKARFQIISILTHTGFTTRESELIVQHPQRRRIASIVMIVSYVAQITLITLLFDLIYQNEKSIFNLFIIFVILVIFITVVTKNKYIMDKFERVTEKILTKSVRKSKEGSIDKILNLSPEFSIFEILIDGKSSICNKKLRDIKLKDKFIQILKIDRGSEVVEFPTAETMILHGDIIIVYGKIDAIEQFMNK